MGRSDGRTEPTSPEDYAPIQVGSNINEQTGPGKLGGSHILRAGPGGPGELKEGVEPVLEAFVTGPPGKKAYIEFLQGLIKTGRFDELGEEITKGPGRKLAKELYPEIVDLFAKYAWLQGDEDASIDE